MLRVPVDQSTHPGEKFMVPMSVAELLAARRRFDQDQDDAEYVEYLEARGRIGRRRRWRRMRERFLRRQGYIVS
jgi:hypothetical protein